MCKRELFVSVDGHGLLGSWEELNHDWQLAIENYPQIKFAGYEFYAWAMQGLVQKTGGDLARQVLEARKRGVPLAAIHLRTGGVHETYDWFSRSKLFVLNELMLPTVQVIRELGWLVSYGVTHAPDSRNWGLMETLKNEPNLLPYLFAEPHGHVGSDGTALDLARTWHKAGVRSGVMFDLVHSYLASSYLQDKLTERIDLVLDNFDWILESARDGKISTVGIHVPMGTESTDSLPYTVRSVLLREVAVRANDSSKEDKVKIVTIEGQRKLPDSIKLRSSRRHEFRTWAYQTMDMVVQSGLV